MQYHPIGQSGLISSNLSLGTMIFGEQSGRATPEAEALKMIDAYLDAGGNHLDTANVYAEGRSEEIVGKALKGRRHETLIATKARFPMGNNPNAVGLSRLNLINSVDHSLRRLQTDYIDLFYVHCWDPITPLEETLRALEDLVRNGKVRYLGISNFKAWQVMKAQGLCDQFMLNRFIAGQYQYSLVKRDVEYEFFDLFESEGMGLLPWGPLGGGFLTGKYRRGAKGQGRITNTPDHTEESWQRRDKEKNWLILEAVEDIARTHDTSVTAVALAWVLSKAVVPSLIIGARTMDQLKDNLKASDLSLKPEEIATLDELSQLSELYPYRMIEAYGQRER